MPPLQVIRWPGLNSVTLTGKARPGSALETTLSLFLGVMLPSTRSIPESHAW
jgi:hypothetical protein